MIMHRVGRNKVIFFFLISMAYEGKGRYRRTYQFGCLCILPYHIYAYIYVYRICTFVVLSFLI